MAMFLSKSSIHRTHHDLVFKGLKLKILDSISDVSKELKTA